MISSGLEELASASAVSTLSELGERERERERESIYIILNIRLGRKEERGGLLLLLLSGSCHSFVGVTQIQLATVNSQVPPASQSQSQAKGGLVPCCPVCVALELFRYAKKWRLIS